MARRKWPFGNLEAPPMAHRSPSPFTTHQSFFLFLLLCSGLQFWSFLPRSWLRVPSHARLLNLHILPPLPLHMSVNHKEGRLPRMKLGAVNWALSLRSCCQGWVSGAQTWKSPRWRILLSRRESLWITRNLTNHAGLLTCSAKTLMSFTLLNR